MSQATPAPVRRPRRRVCGVGCACGAQASLPPLRPSVETNLILREFFRTSAAPMVCACMSQRVICRMLTTNSALLSHSRAPGRAPTTTGLLFPVTSNFRVELAGVVVPPCSWFWFVVPFRGILHGLYGPCGCTLPRNNYSKVQSPKSKGLKSKVGLVAAKASALRINLNIQGCSIVAPPLHAPSRAPLLSHNIPLPRVH
jgi:hypothetical protein